MTREAKLRKLDELKENLDKIDVENLLDDGCDDNDMCQNMMFSSEIKKIESIVKDLSLFEPNDSTSKEELDDIWKQIWSQSSYHGAVEKINFCYRYIAEMKKRI